MVAPASATVKQLLVELTDEGLEIWRLSPLLLKEQDKNARVQSHNAFTALVRNIKNRGALESLPFVSRHEDDFYIISGHHRVRAAIQAEVPAIIVLVDPRPMTRSEIVAKQLAHNSINGKDDPAVLLQLFSEIEEVDAMLESAISRGEIEKLIKQNVALPDIKVDYDWQVMVFAFLPTQSADLEALVEQVGHADKIGVADKGIYDSFVATLRRLGKTEDIRSVGALLYRMMQITQQHLDDADAEAALAEAEALAGASPPS